MTRPSFVKERIITKNEFSRPGMKRPGTKAIDVHWNGNPGMDEYMLVDYFASLAEQDKTDDRPDRYAGANIIIGPMAAIIIVPIDEITYTAGAKRTSQYTVAARRRFGEFWLTNNPQTPNWLTCSIEMVHPDATGRFAPETLSHAAQVIRWILDEHFTWLWPHDVIRHYDITGKECPKWFVAHPGDWWDFIEQIKSLNEVTA